jgi:CRP-like cAMP-binding protein
LFLHRDISKVHICTILLTSDCCLCRLSKSRFAPSFLQSYSFSGIHPQIHFIFTPVTPNIKSISLKSLKRKEFISLKRKELISLKRKELTTACFTGDVRVATVVATTYCELYCLTRSQLDEVLTNWPDVALELSRRSMGGGMFTDDMQRK